MKNRGQFEISFGVIFSIIIIAATFLIAGYIIIKFLGTSNDAQCNLFVNDLQTKINAEWSADGLSNYLFSESVPSGTKEICLGYINESADNLEDSNIIQNLTNYVQSPNSNLFFYPKDSCGGTNFDHIVNNVNLPTFFCFNVINGKASIQVSKGEFDALVKLSAG